MDAKPLNTVTRNASLAVAHAVVLWEMGIVTRSVSEGRAPSQPVPSLTLRVAMGIQHGTVLTRHGIVR